MGRIPQVGEPAPFFAAATDGVSHYSLDVVAGRWIVLMFFGTAGQADTADGLIQAIERRELFDGRNAAFFGVSVDPLDRAERGLINSDPGIRFFWDFDMAVTRLYGLLQVGAMRPGVFLIDPAFRIAMSAPIDATDQILDRLAAELAVAPAEAAPQHAPVLTLPRIFEPELCATLVRLYRDSDSAQSGFAKDVDGQTVQLLDPSMKRRSDVLITDETLREAIRDRLEARLFPMIRRALGWQPEFVERYLICRYGAEEQGFFSRHRDDVTAGTAHRRFAVSMNLNDDFEGGEICFPEFGARLYRPPLGGATVFACGLLHEATPVTRGERFAFVPFLYDEPGEQLRRANLDRVSVDIGGLRQSA